MTIKRLLDYPILREAIVLCGNDYIENQVNWCYSINDIDDSSNLYNEYNKLLICDAKKIDYYEKNQNIYQNTVSVIITGKILYEEIAYERIISSYKKHGIAVIWNSKRIESEILSERLRFILIMNEVEKRSMQDWLMNICIFNVQPDRCLAYKHGYNEKFNYYSLLIAPCSSKKSYALFSERVQEYIIKLTEECFNIADATVLAFCRKEKIICFVPVANGITSDIFQKKAESLCKKIEKQIINVQFQMIVGSSADTIEQFNKSYNNAEKTLYLVQTSGVSENICYSDDYLGDLLILSNRESELKYFINKMLGPILEDKILMDTLTMYLNCGESVKNTAEATYVHINTIKYRIGQISQKLGCDMRNPQVRFRLRMAITGERYLNRNSSEE